eukprot:CAMPEP_0194529730 /NCGR_PEP_ID=MMETSP0253-20130528/66502_1 /TAXON_ID=2966 /ORGANISM="Noctiluca scintillans" /LENGTH=138 /DNA_ID=CAMNT_0039374887 /DNA_START=422 /DNA_END=838 /DNA_ORIENTATION=-
MPNVWILQRCQLQRTQQEQQIPCSLVRTTGNQQQGGPPSAFSDASAPADAPAVRSTVSSPAVSPRPSRLGTHFLSQPRHLELLTPLPRCPGELHQHVQEPKLQEHQKALTRALAQHADGKPTTQDELQAERCKKFSCE